MEALSLFTGIEKAKASVSSNYLRPGRYLARILKVKATENYKKEQFLAIEMQILRADPSSNEAWISEGKPEAKRPHVSGEEVCHLIARRQDNFLPNVKQFVSAICGVDPDKITPQDCAEICLDDGSDRAQPLSGVNIELSAIGIITRAGKPFTRVRYIRSVPAMELKQVLGDSEAARLFPGGALDALIAAEAKLG